MRLPVIFAALTALCWGLYGPALRVAGTTEKSPFKPYVAIGLAYLLWGVLGGVLGMVWKGDSFALSSKGGTWGFIAGTLGAWGAFTLTLAMFNKGTPHVVMPIVFGGAVTVAALVSVWRTWGQQALSPWLLIGIAGILVSAVIVAVNTPHEVPHPPAGSSARSAAASHASASARAAP